MCGWQVKLCDPLVTHGPYLSALEIHVEHNKALYKLTFFTLLYLGLPVTSEHYLPRIIYVVVYIIIDIVNTAVAF